MQAFESSRPLKSADCHRSPGAIRHWSSHGRSPSSCNHPAMRSTTALSLRLRQRNTSNSSGTSAERKRARATSAANRPAMAAQSYPHALVRADPPHKASLEDPASGHAAGLRGRDPIRNVGLMAGRDQLARASQRRPWYRSALPRPPTRAPTPGLRRQRVRLRRVPLRRSPPTHRGNESAPHMA